ncbi:hypothetical protein [Haladaptatus sp. DFWS20]|uniref:hypothetical protein n=1 Tax=Haladaptatus sp. DFWS20 TaxID=3403467 RepID=UPI003EC0D5B5
MGSRTSDATATVSPMVRNETISILLFASGLALLTRGIAPPSAVDGIVGLLGVQVNSLTAILVAFAFVVAVAHVTHGGSPLDCWILTTAPWVGLFLAVPGGEQVSDLRFAAVEPFGVCLLVGTMLSAFAYFTGLSVPMLVGRNRSRA